MGLSYIRNWASNNGKDPANPGQDTALPDMTWSGDNKNIDLGDFTANMHYLGLNLGLGMTIFTIPERSAEYIADLVTPFGRRTPIY